MRVRCPQCRAALNVVDPEAAQEASCPTCGSHFPLAEVTVSYGRLPVDQLSHFDLLQKVGVGQFGEVWKARDRILNRIVAIKVPRNDDMTESERKLFLREAQSAAALEHPHIVRVFEIRTEGTQTFIVSQFINGTTLRELIQGRTLSVESAAQMMTVIADAVHHAHDSGVIHRDLKPSNILVDVDQQPYVSDFGLSKNTNAEITVTVAGAILGTPAYMSPEQARGDSQQADRRSDVYSLGVVLYEMLAGKRPFEGSTTLLLHQIQSGDPRSLRAIKPSIPRNLETICMKALEKNPDRRYQSAAEFAADLRRFLKGETIVARPASRLEKGWRWVLRNRALTAVATIAVASTTLAAAFALNPAPPAPDSEPSLAVHMKTDPPGAQLVLHPIDPATGLPDPSKSIRPAQRTPVRLKLASRNYLVVAVLDDGRFHEVYRYIPSSPDDMPSVYPHYNWSKQNDGELTLMTIKIPEANVGEDMISYDGTEDFRVGLPQSTTVPEHSRRIAAFLMDRHEVTAQQYRKGNLGQLPFTRIGKDADHPADYPITGLFFEEALMYAERVGKRLPTEFEYEYAATQQGASLFPWGDEVPPAETWKLGPADQSTFDSTAAVGLFSNASELTDSRFIPYPTSGIAGLKIPGSEGSEYVVVRGGGLTSELSESERTPRARIPLAMKSSSIQIGFRCVRSKSPRLKAEDF